MPHKGLGCMPTGAAQREPHSRQRGRADSHASTITQGKGTLEQTILCLCDRTSRKTHIDKMFTYEQVPYAPSTRHALQWVRSDASSSGRQCDHRMPHKGLGCMPTGAAQREPHSRQRGRADSHASTITQGKGTLEQTILCLCDRTSRKTHIDKMFTYEQVPYAPSTRHALQWVRSDASSSGRQCDHRTPWAQQATM